MLKVDIWRERNANTFKGNESSKVQLKFLFLKSLYDWTLVTNSISSTTLLDFFDQVTFYNFFIGNFTHAPSGFLK